MSKGQLYGWRSLLAGAAICVVAALAVNADLPRGWILAGSKPAEYEVGVDKDQAYQGHASAFLKRKNPSVEGFGTLMQMLWMRVDKRTEVLAIDNMQRRAIKGTTGWQRYEVVLDVPKEATGVAFGIC
jgi:hypothetical protein